MTRDQATEVFTSMKLGEDITTILPDAATKDYYFFIKAYKLANPSSFSAYCQLHKFDSTGRKLPFIYVLYSILASYETDDLKFNHPTKDGYLGLQDYVHLASDIFN